MQTKNISRKALIILGALCMGSCTKDFLDTKVDTSTTQKVINSDYNSLFSFAQAPYTYLRNGYTIIDNNIFASVSDEAQQTLATSSALLFNEGSWNANNNPDNYYGGNTSYYAGIRAANYFLENSGNYRTFLALNRDTLTDAVNFHNDLQNMNWFRGEAHILRAYYYAELAKRYGGVPLVTKTLSATDDNNLPKTSYDSIVQFIVKEIDTYRDSLQVNWKTSAFSNKDGRFSLGSALALKARVLLYAASPLHNESNDVTKWAAAAAAAHDVIALNEYSLDGDYQDYFLQYNVLNSDETIWAIRKAEDNNLETQNYPIATPGGHSGVTPSQNLVAAYEYTGAPDPADPYANRDPRLQASVVTNNSDWNGRTIDESPGGTDDMGVANSSKTGYYLKKFVNDNLNLTQGQTVVHNWVVFRYADVLLSYAEAMNEAYGADDDHGYGLSARQALQMVRDRASGNLPVITASAKSDFRDVIKHERRVELAFEDHRFWDLLRWKDAGTVLNQPLQGVHVKKNADNTFSYTVFNVAARKFTAPMMYLYPFPQAEISKSKGVLLQNLLW